MTIRMDNLEGLTLAEMEEMVENNRHLGCEAMPMKTAYPLIETTAITQVEQRAARSGAAFSGQRHRPQ
jgi:hypothetical protein